MLQAMKTQLLIPILLVACGGKTDLSSDTSLDTADPQEGQGTTIWAGWNHQWGLLSHRVSLIRVKAGKPGSSESGILGGDWSTGETWSDDVNFRIHQQTVTSSTLEITTGEVSLVVGPDGEASATLDVDADLVVLQGFEIDTDLPLLPVDGSEQPTYDPALGYTSRGFGMAVAATEEGWEATAQVRWGPRDRADMNSAIPLAQTAVKIYWAAIDGATATSPIDISGTEVLAHSPPNSPQTGHTEDLSLSGHGLVGIRGFFLGIDDADGGDGGDYLRSFGVEVPPGEDGSPPATISAEILNTAPIELGEMSMTYSAEALWIELDPETSQISGETVTGIHPIGRHEVPID